MSRADKIHVYTAAPSSSLHPLTGDCEATVLYCRQLTDSVQHTAGRNDRRRAKLVPGPPNDLQATLCTICAAGAWLPSLTVKTRRDVSAQPSRDSIVSATSHSVTWPVRVSDAVKGPAGSLSSSLSDRRLPAVDLPDK